MAATAAAVAADATVQHVVFAPACYRHGLLTSRQWTEIQVGGVSAQDQLLAWTRTGERLSATSNCTGLNCEPSCPAVHTSDCGLVTFSPQSNGRAGKQKFY